MGTSVSDGVPPGLCPMRRLLAKLSNHRGREPGAGGARGANANHSATTAAVRPNLKSAVNFFVSARIPFKFGTDLSLDDCHIHTKFESNPSRNERSRARATLLNYSTP